MSKWIILLLVLVIVISAVLLVYLSQETRQLSGVVRDATNQQPIPDVLLNLAGNLAATNEFGEYALTLPTGNFTLLVQADGYAPAEVPVDATNLLSRTVQLDVDLAPNRVIGVVRDGETQLPLAHAQMVAGDKRVTANAQGEFEILGIKKGAPVAVIAPGYHPSTFAFEGQMNFDLPLVPNSIVITVIEKITKQPFANVKIQTDDQIETTGADGRTALRRVKPGAVIRVSAPGYDHASVVFTGGDLAPIALRVNTIEGAVIDATTNQPISGTLVFLGSTIVATNAQGKYRFENIPEKAAILFKTPGYSKLKVDVGATPRRDVKLAPFQAKGIRIPFGADPDHVRGNFDIVTKSELNAVVVDVKSEKGRIAWDSQVPLAKEIGARFSASVDLAMVLDLCRKHNVYCIARLPVFQDTLLATARPALAIKYTNGVVFSENGGSAWTNPYNQDAWNYNLALAKEIAAMGFDEIQFDYIRFPGLWPNLYFGVPNSEDARISAIAGFLARAQKELRPTGVFISADVFGLTTATDDDQHTGQRLRDLGPHLDYVSPMVYPDTWVRAEDLLTRGLQIANCTEAIRCPYEVIFNSYKRATEKTTTRVRPWLQAYSGRGDFGLAQYRIQKKAASDAGSAGWLFWNGTGTYDPKLFEPKK
ncbi:MAG: carboxypeptidase regulatory-like domain-containing protein [Chloroflexi bacterium]|nr:carboxypeptidase regulatory-like domain-containing protein [Chloroflexota bacterium]